MIVMFWFLMLFLADAPSEGVISTNILVECDLLYAQREEREQLMKAIEGYENVLQKDPAQYEAAWKLSKAFWYAGNHSPAEDKKVYFQKGIAAGQKAANLSPNSCEGHFWLGINDAMYAESSGLFKALSLVDEVKKEIGQAMAIDQNCQ